MIPKKEHLEKIVYRFTENAHMKFRPLQYKDILGSPPKPSIVNKVSNMLGSIFKPTSILNTTSKNNNKSMIEVRK